MSLVKVNFGKARDFTTEEEYLAAKEEILKAKTTLLEKSGAGSEFTGWVDLPVAYDRNEFEAIKKAADKIREDSDVLVVIGIGGSYLGAKAACDYLKGADFNLLKAEDIDTSKTPQILYVGNSLSSKQIAETLDIIKNKEYSINVISKSGTTMETAIAFRIFKKAIEEKYGAEEAVKRIYVTTDKEKGLLKELADKVGYQTFVVPDEIGGRYSVLTAVGLLPIAAIGADIDKLMAGAAAMREELIADDDSDVLKYAWARQDFYRKGKKIELFAAFEPDLRQFMEWLKQLFGESEGKDGKGLFPASVCYTTDLHSMGQMVQDGERNLFETVINVKNVKEDIMIPAFADDFDGFRYLEGQPISLFNEVAIEGTTLAHLEGGVPGMLIEAEHRNEESLGALFYFFEFACGVSAYIEDVNPFNQPGVEAYKKNIKALLAKYRD